MSHVTTTPHALAAAAGDLASVGSTIHAANANAAAGTAGVHAPGGDAVSAFVSALFAAHAQAYQAAGAQAHSFHDQFVQALRESAGTYANAEAANASPLDKVIGSAGHLTGNGAGAAQHAGMGAPPVPGSGNPAGGGPGASGADGHPATPAGPPGANAGGGGVPTGDGGAPAGATNGGGAVDPGGVAAASAPPAWGPAPATPTAPVLPHLATPPAAPPVIAGGYPAAGLVGPAAVGLGGDTAAIGGLAEPVAPVTSTLAASPAAAPSIPTAPKAQPPHQSTPDDAAHPADSDHDKAAVPLPLLRLRVPNLRGFFRRTRSGLRDRDEWREELREAAKSKPWGSEELLGALGLRPPAN